MLHTITCNPIEVKRLTDYHENFIIVHLTDKVLAPLANGATGLYFKVYHQDGMDVQDYDEYEDTVDMRYEFIPVRSITDAFSRIADDLIDAEDRNDQRAEELGISKDEIMVACVCGKAWNPKAVKYINNDIREDTTDIQVVDMYQTLMIPSEEKMAQFVKTALGSQFVYPEDPIAYAYALHRVLGGDLP
ncbi:MAG: hypothetical protein NC311_05640 [Muribaculaceae bacterium]|nr:hypothetical protein [Muribaculaceae bacterium]